MTVEAMVAELLARNPTWLAIRVVQDRFAGTIMIRARDEAMWRPVAIPITPGIETVELVQVLSDALEVRNALERRV